MAVTARQMEAMNKIRRRHIAAGLIGLFSLSVQAQSWQVPKPSPGLMPNPAAGKTLFAKHCATCHGADLKGSDKGPPLLHRRFPTRREKRRARPPLEIRRYGTGAASNTRRRGSHHGLCA